MKKVWIIGLSVLTILILCGTALATDIEINYPNVNIRNAPAGKSIGRFAGGELLPALGEKWADGQLWYHVQTEQFGDGYVSGEFARPVFADERVFNPNNPTSPDCFTENVAGFYRTLFRWLYTDDYCYWDADEQVCTYRVNNGVGDELVVKPIHKLEMACMMARYGLLVENDETALIRNTDAPSEARIEAASTLLKNHFGTDDLWSILLSRRLLFFSEAHAPHQQLSSRDTRTVMEISDTVNAEFMEETLNQAAEVCTDGDLVLYYNPDGGSRYHVDMNCPSTNTKYLPFKGQFIYSEVNEDPYILLMPCNVCDAPLR